MARKTRTLTIWASPEQIAQLDAIAKANRITRSALARKCINAGYQVLIGTELVRP